VGGRKARGRGNSRLGEWKGFHTAEMRIHRTKKKSIPVKEKEELLSRARVSLPVSLGVIVIIPGQQREGTEQLVTHAVDIAERGKTGKAEADGEKK